MHSNRGFLGTLHSLQEWYWYLTLNKFIIFATRNLKVRHLDNVVVAGYSFSLTTKKFNGTLCMGTRFLESGMENFPYDDVCQSMFIMMGSKKQIRVFSVNSASKLENNFMIATAKLRMSSSNIMTLWAGKVYRSVIDKIVKFLHFWEIKDFYGIWND